MKDILEPLAKLPGVRSAVLVTSDGVPIASEGRAQAKEAAPKKRPQTIGIGPQARNESPAEDSVDADEVNVLCGLGTSWLYDVARAIAPMSWEAPKYMVMRAMRGTLIVMQAPNAILLVLLEGGMRAEDLRLPMEAAILRMQRILRGIGRRKKEKKDPEVPVGIFPATSSIKAAGSTGTGLVIERAKGVSGANGEA